MTENELYHYGIKGMKWGVRRNRVSKSSQIKAARAKNTQLRKKRDATLVERKKFYDNIDQDKDYDLKYDYPRLKKNKQKQLDKIEDSIRSIEHEILSNDSLARQRTTGEKVVDAMASAGALAGVAAAGILLERSLSK